MSQERKHTETLFSKILQISKIKLCWTLEQEQEFSPFFCAKAGAKKIYAVEASDIADQAELLVKSNNLSDKITILKGKVEEITLPEQVDVIISEWMGYFLVYESMFDSVLHARDKWLKPDGKMFPSRAILYLAPFTDESTYYQERISFWNQVYGLDFSAIIPYAKRLAFAEPIVEVVASQDVLTWPAEMKSFDCKKVTAEEARNCNFDFKFSSMIVASINGFVSWFDVLFEGTNTTLRLSTSPESPTTHWRQTLLYVSQPTELVQDQLVTGNIQYAPNQENKRCIDITLKYQVAGCPEASHTYKMQ